MEEIAENSQIEASKPVFGAINRLGYLLIRAVAFVTIRPYFRLRSEGLDRLPDTGAFIIAPNHRSYLDPILLQAAVSRRRIVFMMTADWYEKRLLKSFFRFMGTIPVDGEGRNRAALERSVSVLGDHHPLGIFPEGHIHEGQGVGDFHSGVAALALRTGTPIVPVAIIGSGKAFPKGRWLPRPYAVTIRIGSAIDPASFRHEKRDGDDEDRGLRKGRLSGITERVRADVAALLKD